MNVDRLSKMKADDLKSYFRATYVFGDSKLVEPRKNSFLKNLSQRVLVQELNPEEVLQFIVCCPFFWLEKAGGDHLFGFMAGFSYPRLRTGFGLSSVGFWSTRLFEHTTPLLPGQLPVLLRVVLFLSLIHSCLLSEFSKMLGNVRKVNGCWQGHSSCGKPSCFLQSCFFHFFILYWLFVQFKTVQSQFTI